MASNKRAIRKFLEGEDLDLSKIVPRGMRTGFYEDVTPVMGEREPDIDPEIIQALTEQEQEPGIDYMKDISIGPGAQDGPDPVIGGGMSPFETVGGGDIIGDQVGRHNVEGDELFSGLLNDPKAMKILQQMIDAKSRQEKGVSL